MSSQPYINDRTPFISTRLNLIHGNGIRTYCKLHQIEYPNPVYNSYTFSFGTGRNHYCLIVAIDGKDYTTAYIDRVQRFEKCIKGKSMKDVAEATAKLTELGIYTVKKTCPWITRFTLKDDSDIFCNGKNGPSISMAYDYIIKYNMTWYQKRFHAQLPGFVMNNTDHLDKKIISIPILSNGSNVKVIENSLMHSYLLSLQILDEPCKPFSAMIDLFPELETFRNEYELSSSPRDFITRIRSKYSDPSTFCKNIYGWFNRYMNTLHIKLYQNEWFIPVSRVKEPHGFRVSKPMNAAVLNNKNTNLWEENNTRKGGYSKKLLRNLRKTQKNRILYGVAPGRSIGYGVATYGEDEIILHSQNAKLF